MRSTWKYKFIHYSIIKKLNKKLNVTQLNQPLVQPQEISRITLNKKRLSTTSIKNYSDTGIIRTWSRSSTIIKELVGQAIDIHTGNKFLNVLIKEEMIGRKLGEFASTRKKAIHKNKKKET
jgi:small subunit ribosomal protein S19